MKMNVETVTERVRQMAEDIKIDVGKLLREYSHISRRRQLSNDVIVVLMVYNYRWDDLSLEGRQLQSKVADDYRRCSSIIRALLRGRPRQDIQHLDDSEKIITAIIEQSDVTHYETSKEALQKIIEALNVQIELLESLYQPTTLDVVFVPDTNALIHNPDIETWRFGEAPRFRIALIPTVLSELDKLKVTHRVEEVRKKAGSLISRIKGYRSRGQLTEGVTLVRDVSELFAVAVEPDFDDTLPWLNPDNNDDRIIASFIEVMRLYPRCAVILITRDINLQNKAEFARLSFCEPPDP